MPDQLFFTRAIHDRLPDASRRADSVGPVTIRGRDDAMELYAYRGRSELNRATEHEPTLVS